MNKVDYKNSLTMSYASACNFESGDKIIVVTAAGIIEGDYVTAKMEESLKSDNHYVFFSTLEKNARKISNSPSESILLKDAVIKSSSGQLSLEYIHVFINEIIALSFGNIS